MKRVSLIAALTAVMIIISTAFCFAEGELQLLSSYPEDGQTNTSIENLGVKLTFNNSINSEAAVKANEGKFRIVDESGEDIPVSVFFGDKKNDGLVLVLADTAEGFVAKNNSEYRVIIDPEVVDNDGNTLGKETVIKFTTYNQRVNNMVNMAMMFIMFGGIMVLSIRQNNKKEEEEVKKDEPKEAAFNPYKEAKRTGRPVEEIMAEQAKKEEKLAKKKARKNKKAETQQEKKIENCAELLNNVYHVHAPAPISKEDRSVEALKALRKAESKGSKNSKGKGKKN